MKQDLPFYKYQGTGNDFVLIDGFRETFPYADLERVRALCDRRMGIGADGLIVIRPAEGYDFEMVYYNADGSQSMCGNGARCAVAFAHFCGHIQESTSFLAIDGPHEAHFSPDAVRLKMGEISSISSVGEDFFVHTGSPHHVCFVPDVAHYPVVEKGREIRYADHYTPGGTNVNFVQEMGPDRLFVRTYERGVEDETLSCGTGVTAAALVFGQQKAVNQVHIHTKGGDLRVEYDWDAETATFREVWLTGPAQQVFRGEINRRED
ncbi:MAG: diaminopimelate epimerase [Nitritalea sp.]